jgi:hypothetical protein
MYDGGAAAESCNDRVGDVAVVYQLVLPGVVKHFGRRYQTIAAAHGFLGAFAELFGLYIPTVAGTDIVPERWRFRRWKLRMRIELGAWWIVWLAGLATYLTWYGAPRAR